MKIQGGIESINKKRKSVEKAEKRYIFILDKNYTEFLDYIVKK